MTAAGVEPLPPEEAAPQAVEAQTPAPGPEMVGGATTVIETLANEATNTQADRSPQFEIGGTDVMSLPTFQTPAGLADTLEPEAADADAIETVESAEPIDEVVASTPEASAPVMMSHEGSTTSGGDSFGFGEVMVASEGPSLNDLSALSAEPPPPPEALPAFESSSGFDVSPSGLPAVERPVAPPEVFPEMPTVVTDQPPAGAVAELERANAARASAGSGTFDPVVPAQKPKKQKSSKPSALGIYARELGRSFSTGTPVRKAMMLGIPLFLLIAAIVIVAVSGGPPPLLKQWVTSPASMWSGPAAQRGYAQVDTLIRGEEVVFLREVYGEYSLVRDQWGRVGYVNRESLSDERPPVTPESSFPGCRQAPIESDKEPCETRARSLHDACGGTCAADGRCLQRCQDRFTECIDGCKTRLTVPQAVAAVPDPVEPTDTVIADEPTEPAVDKVAAEKPIKTSKVTKPTRTTKKTTTATKKDTGKKKK